MWNNLASIEGFEKALALSFDDAIDAVLIFKHSKRCATSLIAKKYFESSWKVNDRIPLYFLDIFMYRNVSDAIEELLQVTHQSPQVILIKKGKVTYHESHNNIDVNEILKSILPEA